jgi:hypothetical protein
MYDSGKIDRMTLFLFNFGKRISFLFVIACAVGFSIGVVKYFDAAPSKLEEPRFEAFLPYLGVSGQRQEDQDFSTIDTKIAVENKYDSHMKRIVKDFNFNTEVYYTILDWLSHTPEHRRTRFINGLYNFLSDYKAWMQKSNKLPADTAVASDTFMNMAVKYKRIFVELLKKEEVRWTASYQERTTILLFVAFSLIFLVLFMIVPIVIKIEENTRFFK